MKDENYYSVLFGVYLQQEPIEPESIKIKWKRWKKRRWENKVDSGFPG